MYNNELFHASMKILSNRAEQYGLRDDELAHVGQIGPRQSSYANPNYDYQKAHEYYEQHKQLKGNKTRAQKEEALKKYASKQDIFTDKDRARGQAIRQQQNEEQMNAGAARLRDEQEALRAVREGKASSVLMGKERGLSEYVAPRTNREGFRESTGFRDYEVSAGSVQSGNTTGSKISQDKTINENLSRNEQRIKQQEAAAKYGNQQSEKNDEQRIAEKARGQYIREEQKKQREEELRQQNEDSRKRMMAKVMAEKARREGNGTQNGNQPIPGKPNQATVDQVSLEKSARPFKKEETLTADQIGKMSMEERVEHEKNLFVNKLVDGTVTAQDTNNFRAATGYEGFDMSDPHYIKLLKNGKVADVIKHSSDSLYHHGVENQKWGVRRYQNPDGSLTPEGVIHYGRYGETGKRMNKDQKNDYQTTKANLNRLRTKAIEQRDWDRAADQFITRSKIDYALKGAVFGKNSKITKRAGTVLDYSKNLKEHEAQKLHDAIDQYKQAANDAMAKYGSARIKDLKNIKTKKNGKETVYGIVNGQRIIEAHGNMAFGDIDVKRYIMYYN